MVEPVSHTRAPGAPRFHDIPGPCCTTGGAPPAVDPPGGSTRKLPGALRHVPDRFDARRALSSWAVCRSLACLGGEVRAMVSTAAAARPIVLENNHRAPERRGSRSRSLSRSNPVRGAEIRRHRLVKRHPDRPSPGESRRPIARTMQISPCPPIKARSAMTNSVSSSFAPAERGSYGSQPSAGNASRPRVFLADEDRVHRRIGQG